MIYDGEAERRDFEETFDFVIVGSGAAGGTVARVLADTGASIAVIEEGPAVKTEDFGDEVYPAMKRMFRGMGSTIARGRAFIPVLQGSALGGSTVINSAIMWRIPSDVWDGWRDEYGLGDALPLDDLHAHWDTIEDELSIAPTPSEVFGGVNDAMARGKNALAVKAEPTRRSVSNCQGRALCLTGCPHGAKRSMLVTFLPYASDRGATLMTSAKVERVVMRGDRAVAVTGAFVTTPRRKRIGAFTVHANKAVIIAASAIQTPGLLRRSGVRSPHLGNNFQAHPGCPMVGEFDDTIDMWTGATQGYDADHHRKDHRFKIETISLPPEIAFVRLGGIGRNWMDEIAASSHLAAWGVQLRAYAKGTVRERFFGTDIRFDLEPRDMANLKRGLRFTTELFFAAGAKAVQTCIHGMPQRIGPDELDSLLDGPDNPACYSWIMTHLFGTARMARTASAGVVDESFCVHGSKNLYVVDSSVFPSNIGVNPQQAIMGVAWHGALAIARRHDAPEIG